MKKLDLRLFRLIKSTKGQFISITVMIILALTIYVSFSMVADNLEDSIFYYYDITNFADVFVDVVKVPKRVVEELHQIEGIALAQGRISSDVPLIVEDPNEKVRVRVVSIPQHTEVINNLYVIQGRKLENNPKTTGVLQQFAEARGIELEDRITPYIGGRQYPLDVVSIVGSPEYIYLMENEEALLPAPEKFGVIYVTEDFAQSVFGYQGSYNEIVIKIKDGYLHKIDSIIDEIEDKLDPYGVRRIIKRENHLSQVINFIKIHKIDLKF